MERACDQALSCQSGKGDLNSRPLRPEACPCGSERSSADEYAGQVKPANSLVPPGREADAGWTRGAKAHAAPKVDQAAGGWAGRRWPLVRPPALIVSDRDAARVLRPSGTDVARPPKRRSLDRRRSRPLDDVQPPGWSSAILAPGRPGRRLCPRWPVLTVFLRASSRVRRANGCPWFERLYAAVVIER
jgi:hypothetical protein